LTLLVCEIETDIDVLCRQRFVLFTPSPSTFVFLASGSTNQLKVASDHRPWFSPTEKYPPRLENNALLLAAQA